MKKRWLVLSLVSLLGIVTLFSLDRYYRNIIRQENFLQLSEKLDETKEHLEDGIRLRILSVEDLRAYILASPTFPSQENFDRYASILLYHYPEVRAFQYVDTEHIIRYIYPLEGNEAALGLDITTRPAAPFVEKAIRTRQTSVSNPNILVQGALAIVARAPIYDGDQYFGLAQGVFDIDSLLEGVSNGNSQFAILLKDANGEIFWGGDAFVGETLHSTIPVGDNFWTLTIGWAQDQPKPAIYVLALIWGLGGALFASVLHATNQALLRLDWLSSAVEEKTAELKRSQARYQKLFDNSHDAVFLLNREGQILDANNTAVARYGYSLAELKVMNARDLAVPGLANKVPDKIKLAAEESVNFKWEHQKKDSSIFPVEIGARPVMIENQLCILSNVRDITERIRAEKATQQYIERLDALRKIDQAINSSLDLKLTLKIFLAELMEQLKTDAANVLLLDPDEQVLVQQAGAGFRSDHQEQLRLQIGESQAGKVALHREIAVVPNLNEVNAPFRKPELLAGENFQSYFAVPLISKGKLTGVLETFKRSPFDPDQEWLDYFSTLAGQGAIAIDNSQLFEESQQLNNELGSAYEATLKGWAKTLELRDQETEGHSQRVVEMTTRLAETLGFNEDQIIHVRHGALLHDIGKIGVPDSILQKTGKLSDEEWEIMKQHPAHAYHSLTGISFLKPALDIPYCHHERWNGTGYPRGLQGDQIPLAARIFAIVDVYDALLSDRPYRKAWSKEKVLTYIQRQSGKHFDPQVVAAFLELVG